MSYRADTTAEKISDAFLVALIVGSMAVPIWGFDPDHLQSLALTWMLLRMWHYEKRQGG